VSLLKTCLPEVGASNRRDEVRRCGDLVKLRSRTADAWRDAYVLLQWRLNLLLVIPEGMLRPGERDCPS
jgi:hypothetical protein